MELLVRFGSATARDVLRELPDPPTYSAVRSILRILGEKKLITKIRKDGRDFYSSRVPADKARINALQTVVRNFFSNSAVEAACALLGNGPRSISSEEAETLRKIIEEARRK